MGKTEPLAEKNPLYGRATGIMKLDPMPYWVTAQFFPGYSPVQQVEAFATLGGIPHYLAQFDPEVNLEKNIISHILRKGSPLYSEVEFLLHQELRETAMYNGIIQAIALGASSLNEIAQRAVIDAQGASVYLRSLIELHIVRREFSVGSSPNEQSKGTRGLYQLTDEFFRFWYSFVFPNKSDLEMFDAEGVYRNEVAPRMNEFASRTFEEICRNWLRREHRRGNLPIRCDSIGRWWDKNCEIDVVGFPKERDNTPRGAQVIVGECKFSVAPVGAATYRDLVEKAHRFPNAEKHYYLFSKSGFSEELQTLARSDSHLRLVTIDDLYAQQRRKSCFPELLAEAVSRVVCKNALACGNSTRGAPRIAALADLKAGFSGSQHVLATTSGISHKDATRIPRTRGLFCTQLTLTIPRARAQTRINTAHTRTIQRDPCAILRTS